MVLYCRCSRHQRNGMSAVPPYEYARRFHLMVGCKLLGFSREEVMQDWEDEELRQAHAERQAERHATTMLTDS